MRCKSGAATVSLNLPSLYVTLGYCPEHDPPSLVQAGHSHVKCTYILCSLSALIFFCNLVTENQWSCLKKQQSYHVSSYRMLRNAALRSSPSGRLGPFPIPRDRRWFLWCPLVPGEGAYKLSQQWATRGDALMVSVASSQSCAGRLWGGWMPSAVSKTLPETCPGVGTWCLQQQQFHVARTLLYSCWAGLGQSPRGSMSSLHPLHLPAAFLS